jgi:hypothetical protein
MIGDHLFSRDIHSGLAFQDRFHLVPVLSQEELFVSALLGQRAAGGEIPNTKKDEKCNRDEQDGARQDDFASAQPGGVLGSDSYAARQRRAAKVKCYSAYHQHRLRENPVNSASSPRGWQASKWNGLADITSLLGGGFHPIIKDANFRIACVFCVFLRPPLLFLRRFHFRRRHVARRRVEAGDRRAVARFPYAHLTVGGTAGD